MWNFIFVSTENQDANEEVLRQFDMNMVYGPCVGMKRIDRWNRASSLGLSPPDDVYRLLTSAKTEVCAGSLWDGRVWPLKQVNNGTYFCVLRLCCDNLKIMFLFVALYSLLLFRVFFMSCSSCHGWSLCIKLSINAFYWSCVLCKFVFIIHFCWVV